MTLQTLFHLAPSVTAQASEDNAPAINHLYEEKTAKGLRSSLYKVAKIMGDINAVQKGKVGKRMARRAAGKATDRTLIK